jgi:DNA-binding MarR family transcriptional regulator
MEFVNLFCSNDILSCSNNSAFGAMRNILPFLRRPKFLIWSILKLSRVGWQVLFWMNILGRCSQKELLYNLEVDAVYLARTLEEFENKGYIVRTSIKGNRRSLLIEMTEYGQNYLMPLVLTTIEKESEILFKGISKNDKKLFIKLLDQLETNMKQELKQQ